MSNLLEYPRGIGAKIATNAQPYMLITSYESKNAIESTGQSGFSNQGTNPDYTPGIAKSSIALYIPPNALKTSFASTYESTPGAATRAALGSAFKGGGMGDIVLAGLKGAGLSMEEKVAEVTDKQTGMLAAQGVAINNHLALTYKGPTQFRTHEFMFSFFPKNNPDAVVIKYIIHDFEMGMLPRIGKEGFTGATKVKGRTLSSPFFQSPRHWTIDFMKGGTRNTNDFLFKIRKSVITAMSVNHDPNSTVSLHADGSPVQTTLSLTFQEIELPISSDETLPQPSTPPERTIQGGQQVNLSTGGRVKRSGRSSLKVN